MNFKKFFNIGVGAFLAFGVGMHLWNSYQGGFIVTAKTLHPEVWAQLNGATDIPPVPADPDDKYY